MFRKPETVAFWVGRLPHWEVVDGQYFITLHVSGAIPLAGKRQIREAAKQLRRTSRHNEPDWLQLNRRVFRLMEDWLDRAEHRTWLQEPRIAQIVMEAIEHRQKRGDWNIHEYVIMPNHVHLFGEIGTHDLKAVLMDFKRWTGQHAKAQIDEQVERFWQREWFDHWSRSDQEDDRIIAYIRHNPEKAGLVSNFFDWPYASWNARVQ